METIDIIMGTYNGSRYIREQIESILSNTWTSWRLWICDDGSTDETEEICKEYEKTYPEKIFWKPNERNKGAAINFLDAARKTDGSYVMFCDQDDIWLPEKISDTLHCMKQAEVKQKKEMPLVVFTDATVVDRNLNTMQESFHRSSKLDTDKLDLASMLMENKMMGCTMMLNRALIDKMKQFPKHVRMHDWWAGIVAAAFGKIVYLDKPTMLYRQHTDNVVGSTEFSSNMVIEKATAWKKQKQALIDTQNQAGSLYAMYKDELNPRARRIVYEFALLKDRNWVNRRVKVVRYKYWKSGLIRNIGVLLLI